MLLSGEGTAFLLPGQESSVFWFPGNPMPPGIKGGRRTKMDSGIIVPLEMFMTYLNNAWLLAELENYRSGQWPRLVGAGLILRYWVLGLDSNGIRYTFIELMQGSIPPVVQAIRAWRDNLTKEQIETITDWANIAVGNLAIDLDHLEEEYTKEAFIDCCVQRDDIEAVRWVMPVDIDITDVDGSAAELVAKLPKGDGGHPRLRRARALDPDAWWVRG